MTDEHLRVVLQEIKDDLLSWNNGNDFNEWSSIVQRISSLLKHLKKKS